MGYEQWRVGVEFDGEADYSSVHDVTHDEDRRAEIDRYGRRRVRSQEDVLPDRGCLPTAVAARLIERGCETTCAPWPDFR